MSKQPAKSLREAVERALAKAKEAPVEDQKNKDQQPKANEAVQKQGKPAEAPKPNEAGKPVEQQVTEQKPGQPAPTEGEPQATVEPGKQNRNEAPQRFHDVAKQEWANTPESVRAEVHRSISELENGLNKYRQSHEKYEAIREYDDMAMPEQVANAFESMGICSGPIGGEHRQTITIGRIDAVLRFTPDGIYRIDGRVIPVGDDPALSIDDRKFVSSVHSGTDNGISLGGAVLGVDVPE
ncbi:hypothetical protein [Brucella inopinata]|uniref:hypothetical protein n=1 Tax=Brucella inopinata TaxID=1218315 RepID=UPI0002E713D1|nr:hypothetical protein [Brucella inopinata]KEY05144.1 hypothetical protein IL59_0205890 [Brucella suis bv. 4 str. 40]